MALASCDCSALVKLVVREPEPSALERSVRGYTVLSASALATVEVPRAAQRRGSELAIAAHRMLRSFAIAALGRDVQQRGALVGPAELSSLAATQLASALRLAQIDPVSVADDTRMLESAAMAGLRTSSAK